MEDVDGSSKNGSQFMEVRILLACCTPKVFLYP